MPFGDVNARIRASVNTAPMSGATARSQSCAGSQPRKAHSLEANNLACSRPTGAAATAAATTASRDWVHSASVRIRGVKRRTRASISYAFDMPRQVLTRAHPANDANDRYGHRCLVAADTMTFA